MNANASTKISRSRCGDLGDELGIDRVARRERELDGAGRREIPLASAAAAPAPAASTHAASANAPRQRAPDHARRSRIAAKNPSHPCRCGIEPQRRSGVERDARAGELGGGIARGEIRMRGEKRGNDVVVFLGQHAARRVDEPAAGLHERRGVGEDRSLLLRELGDRGFGVPPFEIGIAAQRAESGARRVDQHAVELAGEPLDLGVAAAADRSCGWTFDRPERASRGFRLARRLSTTSKA